MLVAILRVSLSRFTDFSATAVVDPYRESATYIDKILTYHAVFGVRKLSWACKAWE